MKPHYTTLARKLRQPLTPAEALLWKALRNRKLDGAKFRRQHPIDRFIVDFYCHEHQLVIEVDGDVHLDPDVHERDQWRQSKLESLGFKVIRFTNEEVLGELSHVLHHISAHLKS